MSSAIFTQFGICLTGPLCNCREERLGWQLTGSMAEPGIRIYCQTCLMELRVPYSQVGAAFYLDEPYPGVTGVVQQAQGVNLTPPEGKLLHFRVDTSLMKEGVP